MSHERFTRMIAVAAMPDVDDAPLTIAAWSRCRHAWQRRNPAAATICERRQASAAMMRRVIERQQRAAARTCAAVLHAKKMSTTHDKPTAMRRRLPRRATLPVRHARSSEWLPRKKRWHEAPKQAQRSVLLLCQMFFDAPRCRAPRRFMARLPTIAADMLSYDVPVLFYACRFAHVMRENHIEADAAMRQPTRIRMLFCFFRLPTTMFTLRRKRKCICCERAPCARLVRDERCCATLFVAATATRAMLPPRPPRTTRKDAALRYAERYYAAFTPQQIRGERMSGSAPHVAKSAEGKAGKMRE